MHLSIRHSYQQGENCDCGSKYTKMEEEESGKNYRLGSATAVTLATELQLQ